MKHICMFSQVFDIQPIYNFFFLIKIRFLLNNSLNSFVLRLFQVHRYVYIHKFNRPTYHLKHPKM